MKKLIVLLLGLMLCSCQAGGNKKIDESLDLSKNIFSFTILKNGQADAIVLKTKNHAALIDCGEKDDGDEVIEHLIDKGINSVDYLFITHFDKDHVGGAKEVIENIEVKNIIVPNYIGSNKEYKNFMTACMDKNITPQAIDDTLEISLDDVSFTIFPPQKKVYKEGDNDFSLAISIVHGNNSFLFAGDAEEERIREILDEFGNNKYDFLKVPHHGRFNNETENLIKSILPKYSVICDSDKNPADDKTLAVLRKYKSKIYQTKDGEIIASSDGKNLEIKQ
ncbi:MAG: MBL fold metallo-hydrolase [Clostridiaceae bacterium]|nr:MBL fold metallo-hydrolase [Clostridiaceae bacterium]